MNTQSALIIFQKNLVYGKVKTRLAATVGDEKALSVYKRLLHHTYQVVKHVFADKIVFYADTIESDNYNSMYEKKIQLGNHLGERMSNALNIVFQKNYEKAVIIGTDCPELTTQIIADAFEQLESSDVVIGPAADGGYYLLGMKKLHPQLFDNIAWSTNEVLVKTIELCHENNLRFCLLPELHDVDEEKDLIYMKAIV